MEIYKLTPQGYCHGVKNALHIVDEALASSTLPKPIYLLGSIIHNQSVVEKYKKNGCILLEEKGVSKEQLLDKISSGTIIISAHGVAPNIYEMAHKMAVEAGFENEFMGHRQHSGFVGHGLGIEINELTVIAARSKSV
ncbi:MAG: hypothetical protein K2K15_03490, partial [Anaeroplasmataceae bacterium]|nr:hypothetical protein [Anaeroplasmataceae bacterium]